jgi:hypothetical protein
MSGVGVRVYTVVMHMVHKILAIGNSELIGGNSMNTV